ncbi:unnamed protein product [Mytilus coruscus]|uniref:CUB domain-containing protein n=1 Tax=Mytilus coruscus TaxID=42192 RepID=A0A6J8BS95_MYTCO|nr:unnamed protein product [Mytilus coruscus]
MFVALLFLIGIFKVSCQSFCQTSAEKNDFKVATFCQNSVASGSSAIIDGYAAHGTDTDKTCPCSATVSIPNNGTSSLAFNAFFNLQPNYNGCGSSIDVRVNNSGQSTRIRCTIAGSITVNNGDNVLIDLKKESSPEDTRYCMRLQFSDPTATLIVNYGPTLKTNSSTIISTTVLGTSSTTKANVENNMSTSTTTKFDEISSTDMSSKLPETDSTTDSSTLSSMDEKYTTTMQMMLTDGDITSQTAQLLTKLTTMADTTVIETRTPTLIKQTTTSLTKTVSTPTSTQSPTSTASISTTIKTTSQLYKIESTTEHDISAKANKSSTEELKIDETTVAVRLTSPEKRNTKDERSTQTEQSTIPRQTTQMPGDTGSSKDDDIPIEVVAPVASVGGLIIVCVIICIVVGIRRNGCGCTEDTLPHSNTLVEKASTEIKNREKDTYVNPLYDDISLTGKSDRSDRDSMMQEIPSDDDSDDSYRLPESTKIDGELWTHL